MVPITFVVCDCVEPIIAVRDLHDRGIKTNLGDQTYINVYGDYIEIFREDLHYYLYGLVEEPPSAPQQMVVLKRYSTQTTEPVDVVTIAASEQTSMRRVTGGNQAYW